MNTNITSSRICRSNARLSVSRRLMACATVAMLIASSSVFGQMTYWLSGTATADNESGSRDKPGGSLKLVTGDKIILDANKIPGFNGAYTPKDAIDPRIRFAGVITNGANSAYMTWKAGDPTMYQEFTPYVRMNELIAKTPSLEALLPTFFTQSERVYISGAIGQDNRDTPDYIKAVTTNPFNTWPVSIYSSDALDPVTNAPRADMQNAAWVILASSGSTTSQRVQLMNYYGQYVPATSGGSRPWDGSYSMITLEHIIFYGGFTQSSGGAIDFKRSDGLTGSSNSRALVQIKGDVAFVNNMSNKLGGAANAGDSIQFDGNAYFVGNSAGINWYDNRDMAAFGVGSTGGSNYDGEGGAMRIGSGAQTISFKKDAIFIGNLASDMGGALSLHNTSTLRFYGKTVFMGNQGGMLVRPGAGLNGGNGGAIAFGTTGANYAYFTGESYFIGNQTSGFGGALASGNGDADNNGTMMFSADAFFSDNVAGVKPRVTTVYSNMESQMSGGVFPYPGNVATASTANGLWSGTTIVNVFSGTVKGDGAFAFGAKIRGGGAFYGIGTLLYFDDNSQATFLRNSTNGSGGALYIAKNSTAGGATGKIDGFGALFYNNATFTGNVSAINGGAINAGTYGAVKSDIGDYSTSTSSAAALYFGKAGAGSTLTMLGNISFNAPESLSTDAAASISGTAFSITLSTGTSVRAANGTTVNDIPVFGGGAVFTVGGLYVESMYSIKNNQTGGSGGAFLIGSGAVPTTVAGRSSARGYGYSLVMNPLDWKVAGTYSKEGDFALFQNNVAVRDGGAIAAHDGASLLIGSGAKFLNNYAGGHGGAIALAISSSQTVGQVGNAILELNARVADITFKGNRSGVTIDTSLVDLDKILDSSRTGVGALSNEGYMQVDTASGTPNDIYIGKGAVTGSTPYVAGIYMDAYEGMKISLDGGIGMDHSGTRSAIIFVNTGTDQVALAISSTSTKSVLLSNTTPIGTVVFNNVGADFEGDTVIGNGTLRIQGTSSSLQWGSAANTARAGTVFQLIGPATLEANAAVNANIIVIGGGATLRVLGNSGAPGTLSLNAGTGGVLYGGAVNLAGNGRINTGVASLASIASISVGDIGHTSAQTLTIGQNASTLANITLNNAKLAIGLFGGGASDKIVANNITLTGANTISLTSLAQGAFTIATGNSGLTDTATYTIAYEGLTLTNSARQTINAVASGNDLILNYATDNRVLDWNGAAGATVAWTPTSGHMTTGDTNNVLGDVIKFGAANADTVSVDASQGLTSMVVNGDYTFVGDYGITTGSAAWGGAAAPATADGKLTMNAAGKTVTLANANGAGRSNNFTGGVLIQAGTVAAGNAAQLGAALSQLTFDNTTANGAALLVTNTMILDGATSLQSQQLSVAAGKVANIATSATGNLYVINNTASGNGGVFNVGSGATLNLNAQGNMSFLNNTVGGGTPSGFAIMAAPQGGALALADNAKANIDVAAGKTVMLGLQSNRVLETAANISENDSIYGAATSVIDKNGAGMLSINSLSGGFAGTLNVNAGSVMFGEGSVFGSASSKINVLNGAVLGGAATIGGNVTVDGGKLSVDAGSLFGRTAWNASQTMTISGSLELNNASLFFNAMKNKSAEYIIDYLKTGGQVGIIGTTQFDFSYLNNAVKKIVDTGSNTIFWADTADGIKTGAFVLSGTSADTKLLNSNTAWSGPTFVISRTTAADEMFFTDTTNFVMSKNGTILDVSRYEVTVGYALINSATVADENGVFVSQTDFYDASALTLKSVVNNMEIFWTGGTTLSSGTLWNSEHENWLIPKATSDKTFADGDSIVFGATGTDGILYDGGNESRRTLNIEASAAFVADTRFTGTSNWTLTGGMLVSNAGANNYKDEEGNDLSTGQMLLDAAFTGTVSLLNEGIAFNGIYVDTGSGMAKTADVSIKNGTLLASAGVLKGNLIENDKVLILQQTKNEDFADTSIYGTGAIYQRGNYKVTMKETGIIKIGNYFLEEGTLSVDFINSLQVSGTLVANAGATLLLKQGMLVGTLVNRGILAKAPWDASNSMKAPTGPDELRPREPGIGMSTSTIILNGNYVSEGGTIELATYRDGVFVNNLFVTGNSSGTSQVVLRNITAMDSAASTTGTAFGTGTYFMPAGMPASVNRSLVSKRDTPVTTTLGAQRDLKLVMNWDESAKFLPSATVGAIVPFLTWTNTTYVVTTSSTNTKMIVGGTTVSSVTTSASSTTGVTGEVKQTEFYARDGAIANLGTTGSNVLGSGTIMTSGSLELSGTTTLMSITVVSNTYAVRSVSTKYAPSTIDYSESRENYKLVQGRDGNWYFRNDTIAPTDTDLPLIGATPVMADMIGLASIKAVYEHVNARHDALEKGWTAWTNYTHSEDRVRKEYYNEMMVKQDNFQVGADYAFVKSGGGYSTTPTFNLGGAMSFTTGEATRKQTTTNVEVIIDGTNPYTHTAQSTLSADVTTVTAYASARWWRFYLDVILDYSPDMKYKAELDASVPFDTNGTVKGTRTGVSSELGIITNPKGLGQLEIYGQITGLKHHFDEVSSISEDTSLTNPEGYNAIYDPASPNGRRYSFTTLHTLRLEGGLRWGSHLAVSKNLALRPWGGVAYGRVINSDYQIHLDDHTVSNDMRGNYYTFQGGLAAVLRRNWQLYFTLGWTGGDATNNYTLSSGASYHW